MRAPLSLRRLESAPDRLSDQAEKTAERYRRHPTARNLLLAQVWHVMAGRAGQPWAYFNPAAKS